MHSQKIDLGAIERLFDALPDRAQFQLLDHLIARFPHGQDVLHDAIVSVAFDVVADPDLDEYETERAADDLRPARMLSSAEARSHAQWRANALEAALLHVGHGATGVEA